MKLRMFVGTLFTMLLLAGPTVPSSEQGEATTTDSQQIRELLEQGFGLLDKQDALKARRAFQKANVLAGGHSAEASFGLARAELALGEFDQAVTLAQQLADQPTVAALRAPALQLLGIALLSKEVKRYPLAVGIEGSVNLGPAEAALRKAIEMSDGALKSARYYLAEVLTRQRKDREALSVLKEYLGHGIDPGAEQPVGVLRLWLECVEATSPIELDPGVVVEPTLVRRVEPEYPERSRQARLQGRVGLAIVINTDGAVQCILPWSQGPMGLTEASTKAIRKWKYSPATKDGKPVAVYVPVVVEFKLRGSS